MNLPSGNRTTVIAKTFLGCSKIMSNLVSTKQKSESHMDSVWSDCKNKFSESDHTNQSQETDGNNILILY